MALEVNWNQFAKGMERLNKGLHHVAVLKIHTDLCCIRL